MPEGTTSRGSGLRERLGRVLRARRPSARSRRVLIGAGIALLAVGVFVVAPGYVASQPAFVQRYAHLRAPYRAWATSVHAKVPCRRCHVSPRPAAQAAFRARMLGEFYVSLVARSRRPALFEKPTNAACSSCHIDLRTVSPSGDLNIPHRAHVTVLGLACVRCHDDLVHTVNSAGTHTPSMRACLTCHDGKQAKNGCATCHTAKGAPVSHRAADWIVVHPDRQKTADCAKCHAWTPKWCADCHARKPRSHAVRWRSSHGAQVKAHRNCEACHEAAFCVRCHGEVPKLNLDPSLGLVQ